MSSNLTSRQCQPCNSTTPKLNPEQASERLQQLNSNWSLNPEPHEICREFKFKNYYQTIAFVNAIAWIAHQENHHPDLAVSYNRCQVCFHTHAIHGLSENDFICAAKVDRLCLEP